MNSGFSTNGAPYEYAVSQKKDAKVKLKRGFLLVCYVAWCAGLLIAGATLRLIAPLLALTPLSVWILVFLTWRYTQVEFEYSFFAGELTVSRVLANRWKKKLATFKISELSAVYPDTDENLSRVERFSPDAKIVAVSSPDVANLYFAEWVREDGKKILLTLEINEKAKKILSYYNRAALCT